jgi:hypothetical protein
MVDTSVRDQAYVKVRMSSPDGIVETLWAVRAGPGRFRIDNSPWFAYRVSLGDIVEGTEYAPEMYDLVRVVEPSGNRTIRVILPADTEADTPAGREELERLKALGCDIENMNNSMLSLIIPAETELATVAAYLTHAGHQWEYANPKYEDLFG